MAVVDNAGGITADGTGLHMNSLGIDGLANPSAAQGASTKNYQDTKRMLFCQFGATQAPGAPAAKFILPGGGNTPNSAESIAVVLAPFAGTLTDLVGVHGNVMTVDSITYTIRVNGVDTALTFTIANNVATGSSTGQSVAVAQGDKITLKAVQTASQANTTLNGSFSLGWRSAA